MKRWIIISISAILVIAIGITAFILLKKDEGSVNFYCPEIVKCYADDRTAITIEECGTNGEVKATYEHVFADGYIKTALEGRVISKKLDGSVQIEWTKETPLANVGNKQSLLPSTVSVSRDGVDINVGTYSIYSTADKFAPHIENANDLKKLEGSNKVFVLKNDIDMSGLTFDPITEFSGTLIGNGYSIKNLTIEQKTDNVGFISVLKGALINLKFENASVKVTGSHENVGIVCGLSQNALVSDIKVSGSINAENSTCVGGIVGRFEGKESFELKTLKNEAIVLGKGNVGGICGYMKCYIGNYKTATAALSDFVNSGSVTAKKNNAGGILGYYHGEAYDNKAYTLYITDFDNTGDVTGESHVGGLIGDAYSDSTESYIINSKSSAKITAEYMIGGIAGRLDNIALIACDNAGTTLFATDYWFDEGVKYAYVGGYAGYGFLASDCTNSIDIDYSGDGNYVGGIIGYSNADCGFEITSLMNSGNISGADYVGGVFGYSKTEESFSVSDLRNEGAISGDSYVGGIVGNIYSYIGRYNSASAAFDNLINVGTVTAQGSNVGGLIGCYHGESYDYITYSLFVTDCENTGDVTGVCLAGGLVGSAFSDEQSSYIKNSKVSANVVAQYLVGAIAGQLKNVGLEDCTNEGSTVSASSYFIENDIKLAYVGGFAGKIQDSIISDCTNEANVTYTSLGRCVGGIAGYAYFSNGVVINSLANEANVSGYDFTGGIFGEVECFIKYLNYDNSENVTLRELINDGNVTGHNYTAGISGFISTEAEYSKECPLYAIELENNGTIQGSNYVGGIFGNGSTDSMSSKLEGSKGNGEVVGDNYYNSLMGAFDTIQVK